MKKILLLLLLCLLFVLVIGHHVSAFELDFSNIVDKRENHQEVKEEPKPGYYPEWLFDTDHIVMLKSWIDFYMGLGGEIYTFPKQGYVYYDPFTGELGKDIDVFSQSVVPSNAEEDIGVKILSQVGLSVVRIIVNQRNDSVTIGTGFFINNRHIVTNHHCVSTYLKSNIVGSDGWFESAKGNDVMVIFSEEKEDWSLGIVVEDWPEVDLAVIDIKYSTTKRSPVIIASENDIRNGMDVFVIGFPRVFSNAYDLSTVDEPKITKGNLVSTITHNTYEDGLASYKQQCYSALINPGNSGGPVVDKNGNVIGVANASINSNGEVGYFGIDFRELTSRLEKAGISYFAANSSYSSFVPIGK